MRTGPLHDALPAGTPAAQARLYDARRDVHYPKPVLRGWLHLIWFEASLVLGTVLVATIAHGALELTAAAVYAAAMVGLFGVSALYHLGRWRPATRRVLQRLDHAMIFLMIAGTATRRSCWPLPAPTGWSAWPACGRSPWRPRSCTWCGCRHPNG